MAESSRRASFNGWYWRRIFRLATHRVSHGIRVGALFHDADEAEQLFAKVDAALDLIARYDPRRFARLVHDAQGILVIGTVGGVGVWIRDARLVRLREDYVLDPDTLPAHLASTIVHEGTHAWLCRLGFGYEEHRRTRVEAICFRAEIAFVRRLPDGETLLPALEEWLAIDSAYFSKAMQRERTSRDLRGLGLPEWLVRVLMFVSRQRAA